MKLQIKTETSNRILQRLVETFQFTRAHLMHFDSQDYSKHSVSSVLK